MLQRQRPSILTSLDTFLTEKEVEGLISSCNLNLQYTTIEHDRLRAELEVRQSKLASNRVLLEKEESKLRKLRNQCNEHEYQLSLQEDVLSKLNQLLSQSPEEDCLKEIKEQLEQDIRELESQAIMWSCIRCQYTQKEGQNEPSCTYHPGKLKYYSCRQCGQDEYFTCCNRCRDCLAGCTKGLHKP